MNPLPSRGFTWNIKSYFLWKTIKKYFWMLSAAVVVGALRVKILDITKQLFMRFLGLIKTGVSVTCKVCWCVKTDIFLTMCHNCVTPCSLHIRTIHLIIFILFIAHCQYPWHGCHMTYVVRKHIFPLSKVKCPLHSSVTTSFNIQSNFNGSNIFGTMKISSRQG